jgi:opacity protein-like surface antigen
MVRSLCLASVAVLLCSAAPAFAQDFAREGFSVGGGASFASEDFDDDGFSFDDTGAVSLFGGYRFHPNFAVEGRFESTFDFEGDAGPVDVDVNIWTLTANAQVFILTGQFQPYLIGGFGFGEAEVDVDGPGFGGDDTESDPFWRLGVGVDAYVTRSIVLGAEAAYNFGVDDLDDFDFWTASLLLRYRF